MQRHAGLEFLIITARRDTGEGEFTRSVVKSKVLLICPTRGNLLRVYSTTDEQSALKIIAPLQDVRPWGAADIEANRGRDSAKSTHDLWGELCCFFVVTFPELASRGYNGFVDVKLVFFARSKIIKSITDSFFFVGTIHLMDSLTNWISLGSSSLSSFNN